MEAGTSVTEQFEAAVKVVQCMPKDGPFQPSYEMKKRFYGLYKQATQGPCTEPKPAFWEAIRKAKWDAWNRLGNMPKEEAMDSYVKDLLKAMMKNKDRDPADIQNIVETMPITEEVSAFLKAMGPFFEAVHEPLPVPEEERWRFYDGPSPGNAPPTNGVPPTDGVPPTNSIQHHQHNMPLNGDVHSDVRHDLNDSSLVYHTGQVDGINAILLTPTLRKGQNSMGPNGDANQESQPFVSDVSANLTAESSHDQSEPGVADRSSGASNDITVTSDSDTDSEEDFCDSMDQPNLDQMPELVKASAVEEPLQPIRQEQVLMTSTPQGKNILAQAEVHPVKGRCYENGLGQAADNPEGVENGDTPISRRRGGGEVVPGGKGQAGRGQGSDQGDSRGGVGGRRGQGQDTPGHDRTPFSGQGGPPGRRDPSSRPGHNPSIDISEQIAIALQRLQCDMSSVLARLNTLEALALSQAQQNQSERQSSEQRTGQESSPPRQRSWLSWIFPRNLPARTVFFLLIWPLIVNVLLAMWRRRRHRHLRR